MVWSIYKLSTRDFKTDTLSPEILFVNSRYKMLTAINTKQNKNKKKIMTNWLSFSFTLDKPTFLTRNSHASSSLPSPDLTNNNKGNKTTLRVNFLSHVCLTESTKVHTRKTSKGGEHLGPTIGFLLILIKFVCFVVNIASILIKYVYCCKNEICEF